MERIPQPDSELTIFGLSHAGSVLAVVILILAVYVAFDMLRPGARRNRRGARGNGHGADAGFWDDEPKD